MVIDMLEMCEECLMRIAWLAKFTVAHGIKGYRWACVYHGLSWVGYEWIIIEVSWVSHACILEKDKVWKVC